MRVTQRSISRNYMKSLNFALNERTKAIERGNSGLKFKKLSENVADGARAMRIQEMRTANEKQLSSVQNMLGELRSVDNNMADFDDILQLVHEKALKAMQEDSDIKRQVLRDEIASMRDQLLTIANARFSDKYLFGGTNNMSAPFTTDPSTGRLMFNGVEVGSIFESGGVYYYMDAGVQKVVPHSGEVYIDIGLGMTGSNSSAGPDPRSAFQLSISGLLMMGTSDGAAVGKKGTSVPGNLYDLLLDMENAMWGQNGELDKNALDDLDDQLVKLNDSMRMARTELGTRMNYLERTEARLQNDVDNLSEMESRLISSDPAEEAINLKMTEYTWMATLQWGAKILPASLLDFLR